MKRKDIQLSPGNRIKVLSLDSYRTESVPELPVITEVIEITDYPMIIVEIEGKRFELYPDEGYEVMHEDRNDKGASI